MAFDFKKLETKEMQIEYRKLSEKDLNTFIEMRIIAKELLNRVVDEARDYGCGTIQITASDIGVKLYTAYGFVHNGNFMQYKL